VFSATAGGHSIIKPYIFDYTAAGALVATDFLPSLERYMVFDKELIGFRSTDEMVSKIRYYLERPAEAEKIRLAGHERVLREHTWKNVWPKVLSLTRA
jgi:spore maturation protein CgeB